MSFHVTIDPRMDLRNFSNGSFRPSCSENNTDKALLIVTIATAVVILVALSFTYKRARLCRRCLKGYPGIVVPLNLLTAVAFRPIYCIIFGAMSGDIVQAKSFYSRFLSLTANPYLNIFNLSVFGPMVVILYLAAKYFPLFACMHAPIPLMGHALGLLYSCLMISYNVYDDYCFLYSEWEEINKVVVWIIVAARIPVYTCYLVVVLWYLIRTVWDIGLICWKGMPTAKAAMKSPEHDYYWHYVKQLLKKKEVHPENGAQSTCALRGFQYWCPYWFTAKKLPLWFIGALTVMLVILLQVTLLLAALLIYVMSLTKAVVTDHEEEIKHFFNDFNASAEIYYDDIVAIVNGFSVVLPAAPLLSFAFCFILVVHMAASVCKDLQDVARGKLDLTTSLPFIRVSESWRYAGYQVAFCIVALLVYILILWLLGTIGIVIYFLVKHFSYVANYLLAAILIPLGWFGIVYTLQLILCKILFIRSGGGKFVAITNKRIFQWFLYTLFIYNAVLGVVVAIARLLLSALFGLLLLIRLDRVVMMKGFEFWDLGHRAYVGFLYLEHTYNNAVVQMFTRLMVNSLRKSGCVTPGGSDVLPLLHVEVASGSVDSTSKPQRDAVGWSRSHQARNRWLVAYTLLRNPRLQKLTASRIEKRAHSLYEHFNTTYEATSQM